jgi:hypothetical protein
MFNEIPSLSTSQQKKIDVPSAEATPVKLEASSCQVIRYRFLLRAQ